MLRNILILFSVIGLIAAVYNGISRDFSLYNYSGIVASIVVFLTAIIGKIESSKKKISAITMDQSVSNNSSGIQIGGSVNIHNGDEKE